MDEPTRAYFGKRVRAERHRAELLQRELAALVDGLHQPDVSNIERGLTNPTLHTMQAIADALGVALADLLPDD